MSEPAGRKGRVRRIVLRLLGVVAAVLVTLGVVSYVRSSNECYRGERDAPVQGMDAVVYCDYGPPSVLRVETIEVPVPTDSQVLVRVRAAAVNPLDWHYMRGTPRIARMEMGLRRPKDIRIGTDFAGTVEAVGRAVTQWRPGDEVFGARTGAFAEYVTVRADRIVAKPESITFEQAAAVPVAGLTALQGVRDQGGVRPGHKVLINGASGGVGTFAVQIAKALGAQVTGVSSGRNTELVRSLGADHVIDYTQTNFTEGTERYDVIIDNVGNHPLGDLRRVLKPDGRYIMIGGPSGGWIDPMGRVLQMVVSNWFVDKEQRFFISTLDQEDLTTLRDWLAAGTIKPVIDRVHTLDEVPQAVAYLETGRARGKVVIVLDSAR